MQQPIESIRIVARHLAPLNVPFAFVGGAALCLIVDDPNLTEIRPTKDVDVVVKVATLARYYALEDKLRAAGFRHDLADGAPICRWIVDDCRVDIMPTNPVLGMNSNWFTEAIELSNTADVGDNLHIQTISAPVFIATKIEAFNDRGKGDFYASHDVEDIITVLDGRESIVEEVNFLPDAIRIFIATQFTEFLRHPDFHDAFPGHLSAISGGRGRADRIKARFISIAGLGN